MIDQPEFNFADWCNESGGVFAPKGEGLGQSFVLVGGGQSNIFLAIQLARVGADVTILEAKSELAGRVACHTFSDGSEAAMGVVKRFLRRF